MPATSASPALQRLHTTASSPRSPLLEYGEQAIAHTRSLTTLSGPATPLYVHALRHPPLYSRAPLPSHSASRKATYDSPYPGSLYPILPRTEAPYGSIVTVHSSTSTRVIYVLLIEYEGLWCPQCSLPVDNRPVVVINSQWLVYITQLSGVCSTNEYRTDILQGDRADVY